MWGARPSLLRVAPCVMATWTQRCGVLSPSGLTFAARSTTSLLNDNVKVQLDRYVAPPALTPFFAVVCCRFGFAVALIGSRRFSLLLLSAAPSFAFASASGRRSHRLAGAQFA